MSLSTNVLDVSLNKNLPLDWANRNLIIKLRTNFYYQTHNWTQTYKKLDGAEWYARVNLEEDQLLISVSNKYLDKIINLALNSYSNGNDNDCANDILSYATLALLAFPDLAASLFCMPLAQVLMMAKLGQQAAIMLYPALLALGM